MIPNFQVASAMRTYIIFFHFLFPPILKSSRGLIYKIYHYMSRSNLLDSGPVYTPKEIKMGCIITKIYYLNRSHDLLSSPLLKLFIQQVILVIKIFNDLRDIFFHSRHGYTFGNGMGFHPGIIIRFEKI